MVYEFSAAIPARVTERVRLLRAYAKVNLALSVGPPVPQGKPEAGYHPVASWVHAIDLFDDVEVEPLPPSAQDHFDIRWTPSAPVRSLVDWPLEQDLAYRAHKLLQEHTGKRLPVALTLTKRIPVGAGLGGGSSDAAAALMLINTAFELHLGAGELVKLSRKLGSDVAFFIDDPPARPAVVTGTGDRVERIERVAAYLVLILPSFPSPTAGVYAEYDRQGARELREKDVRGLARAGWIESRALFNDLDRPAETLDPRLAELRAEAKEACGQPVHVTGSGSGLFIACAEEPEARKIATLVASALPRTAVVRARLL